MTKQDFKEEIMKRMFNEYSNNLNFAKGWDRNDITESWDKVIDLCLIEFTEYLEFLLSNRLHPEYSIRDLRREIQSKIKEIKDG